MKVTLFSEKNPDTERYKAVRSSVLKALSENNTEIDEFIVSEDLIKPCTGCFACWVKTPGVCIIKDMGRDTARAYINSDVTVILTSILYGCYSADIKLVMDRLIPDILPFFKKIEGEVHHMPRYKKYPELVVIGIQKKSDAGEAETFKKLVQRNVINLQKKETTVIVLDNKYPENTFNALLKDLLSREAGK